MFVIMGACTVALNLHVNEFELTGMILSDDKHLHHGIYMAVDLTVLLIEHLRVTVYAHFVYF